MFDQQLGPEARLSGHIKLAATADKIIVTVSIGYDRNVFEEPLLSLPQSRRATPLNKRECPEEK